VRSDRQQAVWARAYPTGVCSLTARKCAGSWTWCASSPAASEKLQGGLKVVRHHAMQGEAALAKVKARRRAGGPPAFPRLQLSGQQRLAAGLGISMPRPSAVCVCLSAGCAWLLCCCYACGAPARPSQWRWRHEGPPAAVQAANVLHARARRPHLDLLLSVLNVLHSICRHPSLVPAVFYAEDSICVLTERLQFFRDQVRCSRLRFFRGQVQCFRLQCFGNCFWVWCSRLQFF